MRHRASRCLFWTVLLTTSPGNAATRHYLPVMRFCYCAAVIRRDLEALLNARRRWRSLPPHLTELRTSSIGYGIPDFSAGVLNDPHQRDSLRAEIEATIRRLEPRFATLSVSVVEGKDPLEPRLHLRIEALLHAEPAFEPVIFDTVVDASTAEVTVRVLGERADV